MSYTRRDMLAISGAAAATTVLTAGSAAAATPAVDEAIKAFTGGATPEMGGVAVDAPEIAENGNTVPVGVSADAAVASIMILADGNPNPAVATFHYGALSGSTEAKTRIRLAKTQNVLAVAKMQDGSFRMASREVKVTIGGCGG